MEKASLQDLHMSHVPCAFVHTILFQGGKGTGTAKHIFQDGKLIKKEKKTFLVYLANQV